VKFKNYDVNFGKSDTPSLRQIRYFIAAAQADSGHIETNDVPAQIPAMDVGERGRFRISPVSPMRSRARQFDG
jgi:hypothetical protein